MSRRRSGECTGQVPFDFEAEYSYPTVIASDVVIGLASDAPCPPAPEALSPKTRTIVVDVDRPAPTMMAHGIADVHMGQAFLAERGENRTGPRRIIVDGGDVSPTVMAGWLGGAQAVNLGGYVVVPGSDNASAEKPPYRIPLMSEVRALPWNGLTVVSTFSGCGGSCLGFKMAGYRVLWANEFIPAAQDTYRANHPETHLDTSDIRMVTADTIRAVIGDVEVDVLEGSPPCASFSTAGKTSKGWGQVRNYCIDPETRILKSDLTWIKAADTASGDKLLGFEENGGKAAGRTFKTTIVESVKALKRPSLRLTLADGAVVICSTDHRWLIGAARRREKKRFRSQQWQRAADLRIGDEILTIGRPWVEDASKLAGWLSGMFDGEGCLSATKTSGGVSVAQRHGKTLESLKSALASLGFTLGVTEWRDQRSGQSLTINGGLCERLRFLGVVRPRRLLEQAEKLWTDVKVRASGRTKVVTIEDVGDRDVLAISTADKTFIAEGLLSHNSDTKQRTDDLFEQYVRLVDGLRPRAFVAENVAGMVKGVSKGYFKKYLEQFRGLPYNVEARLLDAQWLGVPQRRVRLIFVGVRKDVGRPAWPKKLPYRYSIREAIPWLASVSAAAHSVDDWQKPEDRMRADVPSPTVPCGPTSGSFYGHDVVRIEEDDYGDGIGRFRTLDEPIGANRADPRDLPRVVVGGSAPSGQRGPQSLDDPAPTIVGGNQGGKCQLFVETGPRVVYDEWFEGTPPRDVLDGPAPAIKVGVNGLCSTHFIVEGAGPATEETAISRKIRDLEVVEPESALGRAVGSEWDKLGAGDQSDKYLNLIRPDCDKPCPTVTQLGGTGAASVTHPVERRKFSIAELRRICGFPDDFILTGTYQKQWERLGRAVPPPMMAAVAAALVPVLRKDRG